MSKVIYTSEATRFSWRHLLPWLIIKDLLRHRELTVSMTMQNFRTAYQASYLGLAWQVILPLIMLSIFYFVFGVIMGGRFASTVTESPIDYALALFIGLGFFNFVAQNMGQAPSIILSNPIFVKTLSFPLEVLSLATVLNSLLTLIINLLITSLILLLAKHMLYPSAIYTFFYLGCVFMMTLGISWMLSALSVFLRDVTAIISPLTLILMFLCPIFYPVSMVPKKLLWIMRLNPLALIIEDVRACLMYGRMPTLFSVVCIFLFSLFFCMMGYYFFMRSKTAFADVI
jgi:homopolymeric O-antigen transport system permease protein